MNGGYYTLSIGDSGSDVSELHARLLDFDVDIADEELVGEFFGRTTRAALREVQRRVGLPIDGVASPETRDALLDAEQPKRGYVVGRVLGPDEDVVPGVEVEAFDRDLRSEQSLGSDRTGDDGYFRIEYTADHTSAGELATPDVFVRATLSERVVFDPPMEDTAFNAPALLAIVLRLEVSAVPARTEFESVLEAIEAVLDGATREDLREDANQSDVTFLVRETDFDRDRVSWMILAQRLSANTKIPAEFFYAVFAEGCLAKAANWQSLTPRIELPISTAPATLLADIVLLPSDAVAAAVRDACAKFVVPSLLEERLPEVEAILAEEHDRAKEFVSQERQRVFTTQLAHLLTSDIVARISDVVATDSFGDLPSVFSRVRELGLVGDSQAARDALTTLTLTELLGNDPELVRWVQQTRGLDADEVHRVAELNADEWTAAISALGEAAGDSVDPSDARRRGEQMATRMASQFPTAAVASQLAAGAVPTMRHAGDAAQLLAAHPRFDLATDHVNVLVAAQRAAVPEETKAALRTTQRVFRVAPTAAQAMTLLQTGVRSSADIVAKGQGRFVAEAVRSGAFTPAQAQAAYAVASDTHAASLILAGQVRTAANAMQLPALAGASLDIEPVVKDFPNVKSLFSMIDTAQCQECRSVLGPAAYLVDLLEFLGHRLVVDTTVAPPFPTKGARDVLLGRRPDLALIDLNCANADTELPFIDLVCELLEDAVAPDPGAPSPPPGVAGVVSAPLLAALQGAGLPFTAAAVVYGPDAAGNFISRDAGCVASISQQGANWVIHNLRQTFASTEELDAAPAYVNASAYGALAASPFCFTLPFDLAHEETRRYFGVFQIDRADLMSRLQAGASPSDAACAAERLALSDAQRTLIVNPAPLGQQPIWNTPVGPPAANTLNNVGAFVTRAGIEYADLLDLIAQSWIDGGLNLYVQHLDSTPDLSQKRIANLNDSALDRIHRFVRLRAATQWGNATLNRVIVSPVGGNAALDDACLISVTTLIAVADTLGLGVDAMLDTLETLDIDDPAGTYAAVFLNPSRVGVVEPQLTPSAVRANEAAEAATPGTGAKLATVADALALALGVSSGDAMLLVDVLVNPPISAASLSAAFGLSRIATALSLSIGGITDLMAMSGADPRASAGALSSFSDAAKTTLASGLPVHTWRYLLRYDVADLASFDLPVSAINKVVTNLQQAYTDARSSDASPFIPNATPTENAAVVRPLIAKLPGVSDATLTRFQALLTNDWQETTSESVFVDSTLGSSPLSIDTTVIKAALATLAAAPTDPNRNAVIKAVADAASGYLYARDRRAALSAAIGTAFALDDDIVAAMLDHAHQRQGVVGAPILSTVLLDDPGGVPPKQVDAIALVHSMALVIKKLDLSAATVAWLLDNASALGWLELDDIPHGAGQTALPFKGVLALAGFLDLLAAYPDVANPGEGEPPFTITGLFDLVVAGKPRTDLLAYLATLTGSDPAALVQLDARLAPAAASYGAPTTIASLLATVAMMRTLGLDVATAVQVTAPTLGLADAEAMRLALKSRYADSDWLGVLKQVQGPLRELKRDALVAYLLAVNPNLSSIDDLYDYFLIDTQMSACMETSRIVQAHATVQLFVMRCLMGLEPTSVASVAEDDGWKQWSYMSSFRLRQANFEVWMYPENWYSPDLLSEKSELFVKFETALQQDALTDVLVEDATDAYLEGLDDIAHLDVVAAYYDEELFTEHVFARTRGGSPEMYFHRQFVKERSWTPWARVPLDINLQLLAFSRNRRLTLAWPVFTKEPEDTDPPPTPDPAALTGGQPNHKPKHRWRIQLAVSEYAGGRWREKRVSDTSLLSPSSGYDDDAYLPSEADFNFFVWGLGANQAVSCFLGTDFLGSFALTGCKGIPEAHQDGSGAAVWYPRFANTELEAGRFVEKQNYIGNLLAEELLPNQGELPIFHRTPAGPYDVTVPLQMTAIDWIVVLLELWAQQFNGSQHISERERRISLVLGTLLPFFYGDYARDYVMIPGWYPRVSRRDATDPRLDAAVEKVKRTASDVLQFIADAAALFAKYLDLHQKDPSIPLPDLLKKAESDPEYVRLREELLHYRKLGFGVQVRNFWHPLVCRFRMALNASGVPGLMARDVQLADTGFDFANTYHPTPLVAPPFPHEDVDFTLPGAYSSYNWELFFHLPFEVAMRLNRDQQFDAANDWYQFIFNPVGIGADPVPNRYWITKPFYLETPADYLAQRIDMILGKVAADPSGTSIGDLAFAIDQWRPNPFKPDVVARSRTVALQIATVTQYAQNKMDQADGCYRQYQREPINRAIQNYTMVLRLLGPKMRVVPPALPVPDMTYEQLRDKVDLLGNALLDFETIVPDVNALPQHGAELPTPSTALTSLYFCVPPNPKLDQMRDYCATKLFQIRHCENIDGIPTPLALFAPPIDPGALVRALAAGADLSAVLAGLSAPLPHYRFSVIAAKAADLTQQVATLGAELIAALEKRDGEVLARLREDHEIAVLDSVRAVKLATIDEANGAADALQRGRDVIQERVNFYSSQPFMNAPEIVAATLNGASLVGEAAVALGYALAGGLKLIPNFLAGGAGFGGSPTVNVTTGGESIGGSAETAVQVLSSLTRTADKAASMASTIGSFQRRQDDWNHQLALAQKDLAQMDQQIANAKLHLTTLGKDLQSHDLQARNAQQVKAFMHSKYTNQELYEWMRDQVTAIYYEAYKLAFDTAKAAERCFNYELATDSVFIDYGYWDSSKKGLMSAHKLLHDIKRMDSAYIGANAREYELTKNVSLAQLDPGALLQLKATGEVTIDIPEVALALDHPSKFMQRIRTLSVSVACNAPSYTAVGMTLTLVGNKYRKSTDPNTAGATDKDKYAEVLGNDPRFAYNVGSIASIATSSAMSDSGLFELNFHDERYLPFEGAGAVSQWRLALPNEYRQFDYDTISDVILHLRYTAREGGSTFETMTEKALGAILNDTALSAGRKGLYVAFSVRDSLPNEWWQLTDTNATAVTIDVEHLPFVARDHNPTLTSITWAAQVENAPANYALTVGGTLLNLVADPNAKSLCVASAAAPGLGNPITLQCNATKLRDLTALVAYTIA